MDVSHNSDGTLNISGISIEHLHYIVMLVEENRSLIINQALTEGNVPEALVWTDYTNKLVNPIIDGIDLALEDDEFGEKPCECPPCVLKFHQGKADSAPFN